MRLIAVALLLCFSCAVSAIDVLVGQHAYTGYREFVGDRDPLLIKDFSGIESRREIVEIILLQQALVRGGLTEPINFTAQPLSYLRRIRLVKDGSFALWANTAWFNEVQPLEADVYISKPVIARGEYIVGLYVHPSNTKALAARSLNDIQKLEAVSNKSWSADWETLSSLGISKVYSSANWHGYGRFLASGHADFTLSPFQAGSEAKLLYKRYASDGGVRDVIALVPIPKVQVYLDDSRHWIVSRKHPQGETLFNPLDKGLLDLTDAGVRKHALIQSGFIPEVVASRQTLNPERVAANSPNY